MPISETRTCPTCQQTLDAQADYCPQCEQEFCPQCFAPIDEDATQCEACGAAFALVCPRCDAEITAVDEQCPACGLALTNTAETSTEPVTRLIHNRNVLARATAAHALAGDDESEEDDGSVVDCPNCGEPAYLDEGYCDLCETTFCPHCIQVIDEEDETCPHCGTLLYFDCPNCHFELTTGTEICPNCNVLFLPYCLECNTAVQPLDETCPECGVDLPLEVREVARVVHTLVSGRQLVYVFACSSCGTQFDNLQGACPNCGTRVCSQCQLVLNLWFSLTGG
ncbi:MAG: zinc ribbon domain-containing protein [Anaerolineales bacterium]|nr:zinc ribbon domain-containing protein [Anaerolineales bacterium]